MKVEVAVLWHPVSNSPYGLCGRKATLNDTLLSFALPLYKLAMPADRRGLHLALRGEGGGTGRTGGM